MNFKCIFLSLPLMFAELRRPASSPVNPGMQVNHDFFFFFVQRAVR